MYVLERSVISNNIILIRVYKYLKYVYIYIVYIYACISMLKHSIYIHNSITLDPILRLDSDSDFRNGWYHAGSSRFSRNTLHKGRGTIEWLAH